MFHLTHRVKGTRLKLLQGRQELGHIRCVKHPCTRSFFPVSSGDCVRFPAAHQRLFRARVLLLLLLPSTATVQHSECIGRRNGLSEDTFVVVSAVSSCFIPLRYSGGKLQNSTALDQHPSVMIVFVFCVILQSNDAVDRMA